MDYQKNQAWEQIKNYLWILLMAEYVILFVGLIFGRSVGYQNTLIVSFVFGVFIACCFLSVICFNGIGFFFHRVFFRIKRFIF